MKKLLVGLLSFCVGAAAFAQTAPYLNNNEVLGNFSGKSAPADGVPAVQLPAGVSGGIFCWISNTMLATSLLLPTQQLLVGGGAGVCPSGLGVYSSGTGAGIVTQSAGGQASITPFLTAALGGCGNTISATVVSNVICGPGSQLKVTGATNVSSLGSGSMANLTTGNSNTAMGSNSLVFLTTGQNNTAVGATAMQGSGAAPLGGNSNVAVGYQALYNCGTYSGVSCSNNTAMGALALNGLQSGEFITGIGYNVGNGIAYTGINDVLIGTNINCQLSSATVSNEIDFCAGSTSAFRISGANAPSASTSTALGNLAAIGHLISSSTALTASNLSACGTSPTISARATDTKGTITEGGTTTGCTITWASAYATAPDCNVSSPTGNAFTSYTPSTTNLVIVNASLASASFTYECLQ